MTRRPGTHAARGQSPERSCRTPVGHPGRGAGEKLLAGHRIPVPLAAIASRAFGGKWVSWLREIAAFSAEGSFTFTGTKSHNIHLRHAATVTVAVCEIASPART